MLFILFICSDPIKFSKIETRKKGFWNKPLKKCCQKLCKTAPTAFNCKKKFVPVRLRDYFRLCRMLTFIAP